MAATPDVATLENHLDAAPLHNATAIIYTPSQSVKEKIDVISGSLDDFELEIEYSFSNPSYYKTFTYSSGDLTNINVYTDSGMGTQLFSRTLSYSSGDLVTITTTRISDSATLTKTLAYSGGDLASITAS